MNEPETIREILENAKTIAVAGLSDKPGRPSFSISRRMQQHGYRIIPVNPSVAEVLGEIAYPSLEAACAAQGPVDLVNVFRASEFVPQIVEEAIRLKIPYLWLQEGICHEEAAGRAEGRGIRVVMDRCIAAEYARLSLESAKTPSPAR